MPSRSPWLATWLQPVAALAVVVIGLLTNDGYPAGETQETGLLLALGLVTLPGLVMAVADVVERSRRAEEGSRPEYQRMLDRVAPRGQTPTMRASLTADVLTRVAAWGLLQGALGVATGAALMPLPVDEDWATLPMVVGVVALVFPIVAVLVALIALGVGALRAGLLPEADEPLVDVPGAPAQMRARRPLVFRALLVALGVCLLGLATFGFPYGVVTISGDLDVDGLAGVFRVGDEAVRTAGVSLAWFWALRVTSGMALGGLAFVVVLSPIAFWWMVARPGDSDGSAEAAETSSRHP